MLLIIILTLFAVSLILYLVEVFLIPGLGICGFLSGICVLAGVGLTFAGFGLYVGLISAVVVLVVAFALLYWVMHSRRLEKLALHAQIDSSVANEAVSHLEVAERGVALTRLALVGNASFDGVECEVRSAGGFIEEGTPIEIVKINLNEVYVRPVPATPTPS